MIRCRARQNTKIKQQKYDSSAKSMQIKSNDKTITVAGEVGLWSPGWIMANIPNGVHVAREDGSLTEVSFE